MAAELNFIGTRLLDLPTNEQAGIYEGLRCKLTADTFKSAVRRLLALITEVDSPVLTAFMNRSLSCNFSAYLFVGAMDKAQSIDTYFFEHFKKRGANCGFAVGILNIRTIKVSTYAIAGQRQENHVAA